MISQKWVEGETGRKLRSSRQPKATMFIFWFHLHKRLSSPELPPVSVASPLNNITLFETKYFLITKFFNFWSSNLFFSFITELHRIWNCSRAPSFCCWSNHLSKKSFYKSHFQCKNKNCEIDSGSCCRQNLHWKLGQQTPSFGSLLAYLETMA